MELVNYREAAEQRPPGLVAPNFRSSGRSGRKSRHQGLIRSPLPGLVVFGEPCSHGCRRGLLSCAAPRLNSGESAKRALDLAFEITKQIQNQKI
jgi:hypothetical protein